MTDTKLPPCAGRPDGPEDPYAHVTYCACGLPMTHPRHPTTGTSPVTADLDARVLGERE
jgi:hypothetical protein